MTDKQYYVVENMWKKVKSYQKPATFTNRGFWDSPSDVTCNSCSKDLESKDEIHICTRLIWTTLPICSCFRTIKSVEEFFNLEVDNPFIYTKCFSCKLRAIPVQDWAAHIFERYVPYGINKQPPKELTW